MENAATTLHRFLAFAVIAPLAFSAACGGSSESGDDSDAGLSQDGGAALLERRSDEPAGENCALGGVKVETGSDVNGDGILSGDEVSSVTYECTETDAEFCARYGAVCGQLKLMESSGKIRVVESCGVCTAPQNCSEETNRCGCTPLTCGEAGVSCGEIYDGCGSYISCGPACTESEPSVIRLLTGNLTSGGNRSYDAGHGIRIFQGLKPHIAFVQEFNFGNRSPEATRMMVEKAFGGNFYHVIQPRNEGIVIPNGIVSYYPIKDWGVIDDETMDDRDHVWARIDIPGKRDLWAVSVHIPTHGSKRQESIEGLVEALDRLNIPEDDFVAIGGDFNTSSRTGDNGLMLLDDTGLVVLDTDSDCPIDQQGGDDTNITRTKDYDAIYTSQALKNLRVRPVIGDAENLTLRGLVFDSRIFTPLTAVPPVKADDSGAEDMQHMAVLKDFAIPR